MLGSLHYTAQLVGVCSLRCLAPIALRSLRWSALVQCPSTWYAHVGMCPASPAPLQRTSSPLPIAIAALQGGQHTRALTRAQGRARPVAAAYAQPPAASRRHRGCHPPLALQMLPTRLPAALLLHPRAPARALALGGTMNPRAAAISMQSSCCASKASASSPSAAALDGGAVRGPSGSTAPAATFYKRNLPAPATAFSSPEGEVPPRELHASRTCG
jgi:hypothetical protein